MIGIDIVDIERVKKIYKRHGHLFLEKILDDKEIKDLLTERKQDFFKNLSCYIASKEAVFKACSQNDLDWKDIHILNIKTRPKVHINRSNFRKKLNLSFSINKDMVLSQALIV